MGVTTYTFQKSVTRYKNVTASGGLYLIKKIDGKRPERSEPTRIQKRQKAMVLKLGDGDFTNGLTKLITEHEIMARTPQIILQKEFEFYMDLMKTVAPVNHYKDFVDSGLPVVHYLFHKTGKIDTRNLRKRVEKPIDDFEKKEIDDAKDTV